MKVMVRAMSQSELGFSEEHFRNPWVSASSAGSCTALTDFKRVGDTMGAVFLLSGLYASIIIHILR